MSLSALLRLLAGERRRGWRKDVNVPAQIILPSGAGLPVEITEASPTGFRMRAPRRFPTKKQLYLLLPMPPPGPEWLEVPIELRWNRQIQATGAFRYRSGGRFSDMPDHVRRKMAERLLINPGFEMSDVAEKRRAQRLVQAAHVAGQEMAVRDISATGVGLLSRKAVAVGETVEIVLNLGHPVRCMGTVVWSRPTSNARAFQLGVHFLDLDKKLQADLVEAVDGMIRDAREGVGEDDDD